MDGMAGLTRTDSHRLHPVGLGIQTAPDGSEDENVLERAPVRPVVKLPVIRLHIRQRTIKPRAVLDPVALKSNEKENPHWRLAFAQDSQSIIFLDTRGLEFHQNCPPRLNSLSLIAMVCMFETTRANSRGQTAPTSQILPWRESRTGSTRRSLTAPVRIGTGYSTCTTRSSRTSVLLWMRTRTQSGARGLR
jgi:hypothetical protein